MFAKDNIPISNKLPASYIINLSKFNQKGTHWIAVYVSENYVFIFCSFGMNYLNDGTLLSFLNSYVNKKIVCNYLQIQSITSSTCGLYVILFIFFMARKFTYKEFLSLFDFNNYLTNDDAIESYFSSIYNVKLEKGAGRQELNC